MTLERYNNKKLYIFYNDINHRVEIKIKGIDNCKNFQEVSTLAKIGGDLMAIEAVIPLMAENMVQHSGGNERNLEIIVEKNGDLIFKNEIVEGEKERSIIIDCTDIYPWVYNDSSVTLWTLKHAVNDLNKVIMDMLKAKEPVMTMVPDYVDNSFLVVVSGYFRRR